MPGLGRELNEIALRVMASSNEGANALETIWEDAAERVESA
jgi:hypothetical protein